MPRPYHSPSSIGLGARCPRAWAYQYIAGLREAETPAQALGTAVHAALEGWYAGEVVDWSTPAGQIAHSGTHLLPHPEHCTTIEVERSIGSHAFDAPQGHGEKKLTHFLTAHGVRWAGFRDLLVVPDASEAGRLALPLEAITHDYKSTKDVGRWAKTADALRADVQCNLYGLDGALRTGERGHWCRWVYFQTQRARRSLAVLVEIEADQALDVLEKPAALARELDTLERVEDAPQNPRACGDYGGCKYHVQAGGPCDARRSIGALIQARVIRKDPRIMALTEEQKAKFNKAKSEAAAAATPTTPAPPAPAEDATTDGEVTTDLRPPKRGRKPNPRSAPAPVEDVAPPEPPATQASALASLAARLVELEAEHAATLAKIREVAA
jgi:hypothetical protein